MLTHGFPEKNGKASCAATRSVSEKREAAVVDPDKKRQPKLRKDGTEAAGRGYNAFNDDRRYVLITPSRSWVAANVKPGRELPDSMTFYPSGTDAALAEIYRIAFSGEIETPALFVAFQRAAIVPYVMTTDPDRVVICGGNEPVAVDVKRIRQILALSKAVGPKVLQEAASLRRRLAQSAFGSKSGMQTPRHKDKQSYFDLMREHPELREAATFLPISDHEIEYEIVRKLTRPDTPASEEAGEAA
jgi:hypothetical protein